MALKGPSFAHSFSPGGHPNEDTFCLPRAAQLGGIVPVDGMKREVQDAAARVLKNKKLETQVGGSHYQDFKIQPLEYILANNIKFTEGSIIKYVSRWEKKNGVQDLRKAIQNLEVLIEDALAKGYPDDPAFTKETQK